MAKKIDWLYHRRGCTTCKKAEAYREEHGTKTAEIVDAIKTRYAGEEALKLLESINSLVVTRGKKVEVFDLKKARPDDTELLSRLMGPTGNLRAPTARIGKTLVVGFSEEAYEKVLGS